MANDDPYSPSHPTEQDMDIDSDESDFYAQDRSFDKKSETKNGCGSQNGLESIVLAIQPPPPPPPPPEIVSQSHNSIESIVLTVKPPPPSESFNQSDAESPVVKSEVCVVRRHDTKTSRFDNSPPRKDASPYEARTAFQQRSDNSREREHNSQNQAPSLTQKDKSSNKEPSSPNIQRKSSSRSRSGSRRSSPDRSRSPRRRSPSPRRSRSPRHSRFSRKRSPALRRRSSSFSRSHSSRKRSRSSSYSSSSRSRGRSPSNERRTGWRSSPRRTRSRSKSKSGTYERRGGRFNRGRPSPRWRGKRSSSRSPPRSRRKFPSPPFSGDRGRRNTNQYHAPYRNAGPPYPGSNISPINKPPFSNFNRPPSSMERSPRREMHFAGRHPGSGPINSPMRNAPPHMNSNPPHRFDGGNFRADGPGQGQFRPSFTPINFNSHQQPPPNFVRHQRPQSGFDLKNQQPHPNFVSHQPPPNFNPNQQPPNFIPRQAPPPPTTGLLSNQPPMTAPTLFNTPPPSGPWMQQGITPTPAQVPLHQLSDSLGSNIPPSSELSHPWTSLFRGPPPPPPSQEENSSSSHHLNILNMVRQQLPHQHVQMQGSNMSTSVTSHVSSEPPQPAQQSATQPMGVSQLIQSLLQKTSNNELNAAVPASTSTGMFHHPPPPPPSITEPPQRQESFHLPPPPPQPSNQPTLNDLVNSAATQVLISLKGTSVASNNVPTNSQLPLASQGIARSPIEDHYSPGDDLALDQSLISDIMEGDRKKRHSTEANHHSDTANLTRRSQFASKRDWQERIAHEVKVALKPHYLSKLINKSQYKEILKKCVLKVSHSTSEELNAEKISKLANGYVEKYNRGANY